MTELLLEGKINDTGLAKLMYSICRTGETGTIYLTHGKITASLYVNEGQVVFAASNDPNTRLGELLLRDGMITYAQYDMAANSIRPGKRFGTLLVEHGSISTQDLYHYVVEQVKHIILGLFQWKEGSYRFEIGSIPSNEVITLNISTGDLIIEGIKGIMDWSRIVDAVGKIDSVYEVAPEYEEKLKGVFLTKGEKELLDHVKKYRILEKILAATQYPDFEACRLLWAFYIIGAVNQQDAMEAEVGDLLGEALSLDAPKPRDDEKVSVTVPSPAETIQDDKVAVQVDVPSASENEAAPVEVSSASGKDDFKVKIEDLDAGKGVEDEVASPPAAPPESAAEETPPPVPAGKSPLTLQIEQSASLFNKKHVYLASILMTELNDGYPKFVDDAVGKLDRKEALAFDGAKPDAKGEFSAEMLVKNIKGNSLAEFNSVFEQLLGLELEAAQSILNNPMRLMILKKGLQRIDSKVSGDE